MVRLSILQTFILLCTSSLLWAQEPLTRGEVYDFAVGDVFHFTSYEASGQGHSLDYKEIITNKMYSDDGDTIYYSIDYFSMYTDSENQDGIPTDSSFVRYFTNLEELVDEFPPVGNVDSVYSDVETFNDRTNVAASTFTNSGGYIETRDIYTEGLGHTFNFIEMSSPFNQKLRRLVYYEKGSEIWGNPIDVLTNTTWSEFTSFSAYPNPTIGKIFIDLPYTGTLQKYELLSLAGKTLLRGTFETSVDCIDLSQVEPGIYLLQIWFDNSVSYTRIIRAEN